MIRKTDHINLSLWLIFLYIGFWGMWLPIPVWCWELYVFLCLVFFFLSFCLFVLIVESCRDCSMMHRFFKQYFLNLNLGIAYVAWCCFVIDWFRQLIHFISLIVALEFHGHLITFLQLKQAKLSKLLLTLQIAISIYR